MEVFIIMKLTNEQIERYSRQIILKEVGGKGQEKLLNSKVLVIGAGGLGSPVLLYLAAAGIGTLGIVDSDKVDITNLQRQVIHFTDDLKKEKVLSAKEKIEKINPDVHVITYNTRVDASNIREIIKEYDFIIDGTDNFPAKFLINDACYFEKKPYSHGGILRFQGQTMTYTPGNACYRCIFETPPPKGVIPSCSEAGIIGAMAGLLGVIQASEAIKYLLSTGELLTNKLLFVDILNLEFRVINIKRNKKCPLCSESPEIKELIDIEQPICKISI
jgi:adenylyltransferase/sulfurtransferase